MSAIRCSDAAMQMGLEPAVIRAANMDDADRLEMVRRAAFAPVFASFRALLGDELFKLTHSHADEAQAGYLTTLLAPDSGWEVYVAEWGGLVVGFVTLQLNLDTAIGEIGLNAVHPDWAGAGIGAALYAFAVDRMRAAGMRVATVATGGDSSHAPARRAYEKAGFTVGIPSIWLCQKL